MEFFFLLSHDKKNKVRSIKTQVNNHSSFCYIS